MVFGVVAINILQLQTPMVVFNLPAAREFLTLLRDLYCFVHEGAAMEGIARSQRFRSSCALVQSAGIAVSISDLQSPKCCLALGVLSAWNGMISFLERLPTSDVEDGFARWVEVLIEFLVRIWLVVDQGEALESSIHVFGHVLQLGKQIGGRIAATLFSRFQPHGALLCKVCGGGASHQSRAQHHAEFLAREFGLLPASN